MKHIFGPVNSRRLGRSLGIDLFEEKRCNLNCIYCEAGGGDATYGERKEYVPTEEIIGEIADYFSSDPEIDVVTVTATGEPTLHSGLGEIISFLKGQTDKPIAVLTNGTTLSSPAVREELSQADIVIPSLDSALLPGFRKVDRPDSSLDLCDIVDGLVAFSQEYGGRIWLEILFVAGLNDSKEHLKALSEVIGRMHLDRIQINTVVRPPLESFAKPVSEEKLQEIALFFSNNHPDVKVDVLPTSGAGRDTDGDGCDGFMQEELVEKIVEMLKRRPCTLKDICNSFPQVEQDRIELILAPLLKEKRLRVYSHNNLDYYQMVV